MQEQKKVRWGVLGPGKIARKFTEAASRVENATVTAVGSRNEGRAKEFAGYYKIPHFYGSYQALMQSDEVDAIYIATPHSAHHELTLACIENKKAVLCEKAFAMNTKEVKEMVEAAKKAKVFLMEAMWTRFLPHFEHALEIVQSGTLGKVKSIQADFGFKAPEDPESRLYNLALGGGALMDVGLYPIFLVLSVLGKPSEIIAKAAFADTGADTQETIFFGYPEGVQAVTSSSIITDTSIIAQINLEKGRIEICRPWYQPSSLKIYNNRFDYQYENYEVFGQNGYEHEIKEASADILANKVENTKMTHANSLMLMECLDEVRAQIGLKYPNHD